MSTAPSKIYQPNYLCFTMASANFLGPEMRKPLQDLQRKEITEFSMEIDHAAEERLVKNLDLHIIPIVMLLYLFSFLDRQVFLVD